MFRTPGAGYTIPPGIPIIGYGCSFDGVMGWLVTWTINSVEGGWFPGDEFEIFYSPDNVTPYIPAIYGSGANPFTPSSLPATTIMNNAELNPGWFKVKTIRNGTSGSFSTATHVSCP